MTTSLDKWHLCDELSVNVAAYLIAGHDPEHYLDNQPSDIYGEPLDIYEPPPPGFIAAMEALSNAILAGKLTAANIRYGAKPNVWAEQINGRTEYTIHELPDWNLTTVDVDVLRAWLTRGGRKPPPFFASAAPAPDVPGYCDPKHARWAPKLAAAHAAWYATDDAVGTTPAQDLQRYLREHAAEHGLIRDGKFNEQGIEEIAKVANWKPRGGAPKTPG